MARDDYDECFVVCRHYGFDGDCRIFLSEHAAHNVATDGLHIAIMCRYHSLNMNDRLHVLLVRERHLDKIRDVYIFRKREKLRKCRRDIYKDEIKLVDIEEFFDIVVE
jgi:hypothetical protein